LTVYNYHYKKRAGKPEAFLPIVLLMQKRGIHLKASIKLAWEINNYSQVIQEKSV